MKIREDINKTKIGKIEKSSFKNKCIWRCEVKLTNLYGHAYQEEKERTQIN